MTGSSAQDQHSGQNKMSIRKDIFFLRRIRQHIYDELMHMGKILDMPINDYPLYTIYIASASYAADIEKLFKHGDTDPFIELRTSYEVSVLPVSKKTVRAGFYALCGDPLHWGHLLIGLSAIARLRLDKMIYIISDGNTGTAGTLPRELRHPMGQNVLKHFDPLFCYSSIALDTGVDGEENFIRILNINPEQRIDAFYIVDDDAFQQSDSGAGISLTLRRLEDAINNKTHGFNDKQHRVSAALVEHPVLEGMQDTFLNVELLPRLPFSTSSSTIREAFSAGKDKRALAMLPYTVYADLRSINFYNKEIVSDARAQKHNASRDTGGSVYAESQAFV